VGPRAARPPSVRSTLSSTPQDLIEPVLALRARGGRAARGPSEEIESHDLSECYRIKKQNADH